MSLPEKGAGIYVHIPFCVRACPYCNFNFRLWRHSQGALVEHYLTALCTEWQLRESRLPKDQIISTIYFGGGTPSLLSPEQVGRLLNFLRANSPRLQVAGEAEVTLEANPEHLLDGEYLRGLRRAGVNRLSVGAQSSDNALLKTLGRDHQGEDLPKALENARQAGFENLSIDLIYGIPGQTHRQVEQDLAVFLELEPEHISTYLMTIEEKTSFGIRSKKGKLLPVPEESQSEFFSLVDTTLRSAGYTHYEISNFAKSGFESNHNQHYWKYRPYIGLGAGAHSFFPGKQSSLRWWNIRSPKRYVDLLGGRQSPIESEEVLRGRRAMGEFVFTRLRLRSGLPLQEFLNFFSVPIQEIFGGEIERLMEEGLVELLGSAECIVLQLTERGRLFSDSVFEAFVE